jgi:hypothetical protein
VDEITIPLTQGQMTVIDATDYPLISGHNWWAQKVDGGFYAVTKIRQPDGRRRAVQMQRLLMGDPPGLNVDHRNRDTLDNRRANLRVATDSQNKANTPRYRNNRSGFKGVYWKPRHRQWEVQIRHHGRCHFLGYFRTAEEAARAYDAGARELHGAFARCNFPDG